MFGVTMEQLFERVRDAYPEAGDLLEAIGVSYGELLVLLNEQGLLREETLPFIFEGEEEDVYDNV